MPDNKTQGVPSFSHFILWFGAAVSIAEIYTGALIAPLGFSKGVQAILLGHLLGVVILGLTGIIGAEKRISAIESTRISFGKYGSYGFSVLNILQLLGWTAVMIIVGARSVNEISKILWGFNNQLLWSIFIGLLICLWIGVGIKKLNKVNALAVGLLFILTIVLSTIVFKNPGLAVQIPDGELSFGAAVELSVIMPLSWLPLISDYTRYSKSRKGAFWGSAGGYFVGSSWMYVIGLGAAIVAGNSDISAILLSANLGIAAMGIVVLSTVTTTFLDAYSAGVSYLNIWPKANDKIAGLVMTFIGTVLAVIVPMEQYENFLYAIGSVFAPLFAILLTEYYIFRKKEIKEDQAINWLNMLIWVIGVVLYQQFAASGFFLGSTLPVMVITAIFCILGKGVVGKWISSKNV
ncbi:hydrogenase expression protein [Dehalobacter restrictus DSM 9455]|uniref:Hydrogenase expression protein n=1 Tax=Dehalobacter restrictus (strain DSM 9455 / PER-K23) TaxID=871738 RepID=A0ABN4BMS8_DEHRP|nr:hydrogenase expression protein [Dehalobacter restrictus DSM 9455]